jgi:ADP-dependent NAD(P)H-hydrate dehydratase / NAD(P)H-hydrate epimerase
MKNITASDVNLHKRTSTSHKGQNGRLLIIGGSIDYVGAVALAGRAAFRTGIDNVTILAPEKVAWALNILSPDFITIKEKGSWFTSGSVKRVAALARTFDAVLIGNGLGVRPQTRKFANALTHTITVPKVIDADAIKAASLQGVSNALFTPHRKEFQILLRNSKCTEKNIQPLMKNNVIVVKGKTDTIIAKEKTAKNTTGNAGMTVSGTGDVLAGIAAGFLAQGNSLWNAAVAATYINGKIGDALMKEYGYGFTASDMIREIGKYTHKFQK